MAQMTTQEGHREFFAVDVPEFDTLGGWVRIFEHAAELGDFLARNTENEYYSQTGEPLGAICRVNFGTNGQVILSKLAIESGQTARDHDEGTDRVWLNTAYYVRDTTTREIVTVYHVSIDGDA